MTVFESSWRAEKNLSLIFEFDEEILEIIGNEKDETKLIFEKYQLPLTSNISDKTSSNWACRGCFGIITLGVKFDLDST